LLKREVAKRNDPHDAPLRQDQQTPDRVLSHEPHRSPDRLVGRHRGELATADVHERSRVRVAARGEPAYHDIAIGDDADDLIAVGDDDVADAHVAHRLRGIEQRRARWQCDGILSHHVLNRLVFRHDFPPADNSWAPAPRETPSPNTKDRPASRRELGERLLELGVPLGMRCAHQENVTP
jgi:hypothetical protein